MTPLPIDAAVVATSSLDAQRILGAARRSEHTEALVRMIDPHSIAGDFEAAIVGLVRDVLATLAAQPTMAPCRRVHGSDPFNTAPRRRKTDWDLHLQETDRC